ncbi:peptidoglycan binding domain containing protein [Phlyctema vagabunda]|uniref:Peptidoglycan binding domain containing protein n=1 Tax=Phlyctema vagabunda TaxID=108571 RepID=A0ABR4PFW4_9HELO
MTTLKEDNAFVPSSEPFDAGAYYKQRDAEAHARMLAQRPPRKRLIVCCDGTWQSSNHGIQSIPSNVAKISRSLEKYTKDIDGSIIHQVVFYDAGVGTATDSVDSKAAKAQKSYQGAFGEGLDENVCEAYNFLVNNYNPGDEVYFFGFSRGAYTARATSGLVARIGLCSNAMMDDFYRMYNAYKKKKATDQIKDTDWGRTPRGMMWLGGCQKDINIKVVGVFDTVGALGWPNNTHVDVTSLNSDYAFHNTEVHPEIENAFQALALDEHRAAFPPTLWSLPKPPPKKSEPKKTENLVDWDKPEEKKSTNLIQCWFPGFHINCGGGSDDMLKERKGDFESMANVTFAWMVDRVQQYTPLSFNESAIFTVINRYAENISAIIKRDNPLDKDDHKQIYRGWGVGPSIDSMDWKMKGAGSVTRTPGQYVDEESRITNEFIHPVVGLALDKRIPQNYAPESLTGFIRKHRPETKDPDPKPQRYEWEKKYTLPQQNVIGRAVTGLMSYLGGKSQPASKGEITLHLPEFVIPPDEIIEGQYRAPWGHSIERYLIRADTSRYWFEDGPGADKRKAVVQRTIKFIEELDIGNGYNKPPLRLYDSSVFKDQLADALASGLKPMSEEDMLKWERELDEPIPVYKEGEGQTFSQDGFSQTGFK